MVINLNNSQINSFNKGMNSDSAYDQIENSQYVFGQNIRITKNQLLGGSEDYSSYREGIVAPVPAGRNVATINIGNQKQSILAVRTVDRLGVLVTNPNTTGDIWIYRFILNESTDTVQQNSFECIWKGTITDWVDNGAPEKISAVLYKELDNVIKLYIATGSTPIISMRVDDDGVLKLSRTEGGQTVYVGVDELINNRIMPDERIRIDEIISGRLTTSQVQYTYRYYNKYGNSTQLAPLTNKILVIDSSRAKEVGNAENTETSIGFSISIDTSRYIEDFDRLLVFRLQYIKPGEDAEVSLIYDDEVTSNNFVLNDVGIDPIQSYTMEEFSAMQGLILIPHVLEQNQEYMFCANVKDDTILRDIHFEEVDDDRYITAVKTKVSITSSANSAHIPYPSTDKYVDLDTNITTLSNDTVLSVEEYLNQRGVNAELVKSTYNDIFTSSLLRSLRRGETYKYAIIFYDKYGRRSDVMPIGSKTIDPISLSNLYFTKSSGLVDAAPIGVKIKLPSDLSGSDIENIIGCQIVRRSSSEIYQNTLLQVALSRPIQQGLLYLNVTDPATVDENTKDSPFYPSGFLSTNDIKIIPARYTINGTDTAFDNGSTIAETKNNKLFQSFSSEIDFRRDDVLSKLSYSDLEIKPVEYINGSYKVYNNGTPGDQPLYGLSSLPNQAVQISNGLVNINRRWVEPLTISNKQAKHWVFNFFSQDFISNPPSYKVNQVKDVKIPDWNSAFSDIQTDDDGGIYTAIKKYRSYVTNIDSYVFNNWISFCKYDLRPGYEEVPNQEWSGWVSQELLAKTDHYNDWLNHSNDPDATVLYPNIANVRNGYIGAGSSAFLISAQEDVPNHTSTTDVQTVVCNITHTPKLSNVESKETERYFGFGNYFRLQYTKAEGDTDPHLYILDSQGNIDKDKQYMVVFDGDIYITPHEITTQYKTYNFESVDTLQSTQVTNYIPMESKVNTYFDYGMNLMNTGSENLLYEPGSIDGVTTQERPVHQYNMIYSDNDASNDVFTLITTDENETNNFKQRAYYSELKSNGEFIDNFLIYKAASFIDVDSKYGEITNMLTNKNTLYYWQDSAFGKFSVNERSLVNDQNNNTIMLGQAGILSRYDYLSTKYGMRLYDFCATSTENGLFWIDINNKAIAGIRNNQVINFGEYTNVQNIINNKISNDIPEIDYDLQNDELLCKCLTDGEQLVFNLKYNVATSVYTRGYNKFIYIKNHIYGIHLLHINSTWYFVIDKYNYLGTSQAVQYLKPLKLSFIVNPSASVTKVFDSQQLVPITRDKVITNDHILKDTTISFETDIVTKDSGPILYQDEYSPTLVVDRYSDREGNIIYNIPRYQNKEYGNRMRGKWMRVNIHNPNPTSLFTISHIITKFRQSFS